MRKRKIKTIKKKKLTKEEANKLIDSLFPPLTNESKGKTYIKPETIKLPGDRCSGLVKHFSELAQVDKEGKEYPFEIDAEKARNIFYSPPEKSPYTADFTRLTFWEGVLGRLNNEEQRFLGYHILEQLKQRQVARKEGMSQSRVSQKYKKLWKKLAFVPHLTPVFFGARRRERLGKILGKLIEKRYGRGSKG